MAQKVEVRLVDDLDGDNADETVKFALDGTEYEIDLSSKHALALRQSLDQFIGVGRRVGRMSSAGRRGLGRAAGSSSAGNRERNQAIREWAKSKGMEVSDRGRISQELVDQYEAEVGK
jgi:hypothetical protein